jgi:hypothetical protein
MLQMQKRCAATAAAIVASATALAATPSAQADVAWQDGRPAMSTYTQCVINTVETGADAWAGYLMDPASPPRPGEVFYAHAAFAALTHRCGDVDMAGELDLVLPPGVSPAIDAAHPIRCYYQDPDATDKVPNPTCPTHTIPGALGPQLPAGDGGGGWDLPAGRTFEVQFPLVSNRQLMGPAGGHCPATADEIPFNPNRDCLITALHVIDGDTNPWLMPSEELFLAPPAGPTPTGPTPTGPTPTGPTPTGPKPGPGTSPKSTKAKLSLALPAGQRLRSIARARALRVTCATTAAGACRVRATIAGKTARSLKLSGAKATKPYALGSASAHLSKAGRATLKIKLSRKVAAALGRARTLRVLLTASGDAGASGSRSVTLER